MDEAYRIRAAKPEDIDAVVALERGTETLPHWPVTEYLSTLPVAGSKRDMGSQSRCFVVAEDRAEYGIVGFAVAKSAPFESETIAELESVGVVERVRRSGVGTALCEAVIEWSRSIGAKAIDLEVRSRSAGPIALYEGLGFAAIGRRTRYYRAPDDDAILMRLDLTSYTARRTMDGGDL